MAAPLPDPRPTQSAATALLLGFAVAAVGALFPLLPPTVRPWNVAVFGAVGLFVAARGGRLGLPAGMALGLGSKLAFDLMNFAQHGSDPAYLPSRLVYGCLAVYAVLGWALLRRGRNPLAVAGVTFLASLQFFLVTNFASWVSQSLPYDRGPVGLLESYGMALPFWRGTLLGDVGFAGLLFGLHALLTRAAAPVARPAAVPVEGDR